MLCIAKDAAELSEQAAQRVIDTGRQAIQRQGFFRLALSGGRSPQGMFRRLAAQPGALDWALLRIFWVDERWVGPGNSESNFGEATRQLLAFLPEQPRLHPMVAQLDSPESSARAYEALLKSEFGGGPCAFDLCVLGMGADGHTASLFPGSPLLHEEARLCAPSIQAQSGAQRLTLTLPVLNACHKVLFLLSGAEKAPVFRAMRRHHEGWKSIPAAMVRPPAGDLEWLVTPEVLDDPDEPDA